MLALDRDYQALSLALAKECKRRSIPMEVKELNPQGYGDVFFLGLDGRYSGEIKGAGEYLGDPDHLIQQLKAQSQNADHLYVFVYGEMEEAEDGNSYSLKVLDQKALKDHRTHTEYSYQRTYTRHKTRVSFTAARKILWRIRQEGFHVIECRNLEELASELCNWYECGTTVGTTFTRLQPEKYYIREEDKARRDFMLTLMGIQGAGVGEELADAIATWVGQGGVELSLANLIGLWRDPYEAPNVTDQTLAAQPLRNGKRRVGEAAVKKLRKALGVSE